MGIWVILDANGDEKNYRLPNRCCRCTSKDVYSELSEDGEWVKEICGQCDASKRFRLVRTKEVSS